MAVLTGNWQPIHAVGARGSRPLRLAAGGEGALGVCNVTEAEKVVGTPKGTKGMKGEGVVELGGASGG